MIAAGIPADWLEGEGVAVAGLRTPQGAAGLFAAPRQRRAVCCDVDAGSSLPPGGLVLPWPYASAAGQTHDQRRAAQWKDGELRINALPAACGS